MGHVPLPQVYAYPFALPSDGFAGIHLFLAHDERLGRWRSDTGALLLIACNDRWGLTASAWVQTSTRQADRRDEEHGLSQPRAEVKVGVRVLCSDLDATRNLTSQFRYAVSEPLDFGKGTSPSVPSVHGASSKLSHRNLRPCRSNTSYHCTHLVDYIVFWFVRASCTLDRVWRVRGRPGERRYRCVGFGWVGGRRLG